MAEDRTKGEEILIKRDRMRQECRPIKRTKEEGEPSKNKLSLDPISTENQDTEETTEVLEFGDHRDLIQRELFIQHMQEAIEVEVNIAEERSQKISGLVQPPRTVHLTKNQPDISSESLQQKNASVTRPNGKDQEGKDGNMR
ncbi:Hypothetical predicted protein [Olea europaea subsp. europaea]|uniref:Uncharacterized protein n=1 Tax=Olea europaea subsp. europaea TaxID=158383 RepID=A0A8S0UWF1_OLEEU|nr:Hypothetical predicted protein [Olea europaea subsp. europaea]